MVMEIVKERTLGGNVNFYLVFPCSINRMTVQVVEVVAGERKGILMSSDNKLDKIHHNSTAHSGWVAGQLAVRTVGRMMENNGRVDYYQPQVWCK